MFVFTETWLNDNIPDSAIQLQGLTCYREDRDSSLSGKTCGGGLCVYVNKEWCNNAVVVTKHCSSLVEFMFVKYQPLYLPREFTAIVIESESESELALLARYVYTYKEFVIVTQAPQCNRKTATGQDTDNKRIIYK